MKVWSFLILAVLVSACSAVQPESVSLGNNTANPSTPSPVPMRVVKDGLGTDLVIPVHITRAVSLAPSITESIFAVGAGDRLVGVTTFCDYPEGARTIAKVGDTINPNIEAIVVLKPEVVFVSTASQLEAFSRTLEANGIKVYVSNPKSLGGVLDELEQFSIIFDTDTSKTYLYGLRRRMREVMDSVGTGRVAGEFGYQEAVRVFVQISKEPLFTIGKDSFLNDIIEAAGGRSVTRHVETAYPKLSKETALALQPEVIILSESADNREPNDVLKNSPAVKNGRVYRISADIISRPGPRLVDALEQIAGFLHPDKLRNTN